MYLKTFPTFLQNDQKISEYKNQNIEYGVYKSIGVICKNAICLDENDH